MRLVAFTRHAGDKVKLEYLDDAGVTRVQKLGCKREGTPLREMILRTFFMSVDAPRQGYRVSVDPETGEVEAPKWFGEQRGRAPIGKRAMTDAERARRARQKRKELGKC